MVKPPMIGDFPLAAHPGWRTRWAIRLMGRCPDAPLRGLSPPGYEKRGRAVRCRLTDAGQHISIGVRYSRDAMTAKEEGPPTVAGFSFPAHLRKRAAYKTEPSGCPERDREPAGRQSKFAAVSSVTRCAVGALVCDGKAGTRDRRTPTSGHFGRKAGIASRAGFWPIQALAQESVARKGVIRAWFRVAVGIRSPEISSPWRRFFPCPRSSPMP